MTADPAILQTRLPLLPWMDPRTARLPGGIEANTGLTHPNEQGTHPRRERAGGMRDARAGLQHQAGHAAHGDMGAHPVDIHDDESAVEHVELPFLDVEHREALLDRYRARWRQRFVHDDDLTAPPIAAPGQTPCRAQAPVR